jgi:hypothetical protein
MKLKRGKKYFFPYCDKGKQWLSYHGDFDQPGWFDFLDDDGKNYVQIRENEFDKMIDFTKDFSEMKEAKK